MTVETILHRLHRIGKEQPNAPAYHEKRNGTWEVSSWSKYLSEVRQAARALIALGVEPGGAVTILGFNRPEWAIFDLAAMLAGGVAAGIYTTNSPTEVKYIVEHAEASVILLEDEGQLAKIREVRDDLACLKHIVMMKGNPAYPDALSWDDFMAEGNKTPETLIGQRLNELKMEQLATLIYTSGTTGPPKGVMLNHLNLAWTAETAQALLDLNVSDSVLSYLPLSHIAEQMFTLHAAVTAGYQVYYAESGLKVLDNLKEVRPTVLFGVPRVWERFYNGVTAKLQEATGAKAKIATWALGVGRAHLAVLNRGQQPGTWLKIQHGIANKLFFGKVKAALGVDRVRHGVSGAAPIAKEILEFFSGLDLPIYEVYGQSEDSGPTTVNRPGATKYGSVGQAWPGVQVRLAEDGEIQVKGNNVFMGYYRNPESTAETLTADGWLLSGDLGQFDSEGYLTIVGRKKEIIITSGGKNIAPKNIEAALKNLTLVGDAVVIGDNRRFIAALISLEPEAAEKFAAEHNLSRENLHQNPQMVAAVQKGIDSEVNSLFAKVEQVRAFRILDRPLSVEHGELTPTLKVKRKVVNQHFAEIIEEMYKE